MDTTLSRQPVAFGEVLRNDELYPLARVADFVGALTARAGQKIYEMGTTFDFQPAITTRENQLTALKEANNALYNINVNGTGDIPLGALRQERQLEKSVNLLEARQSRIGTTSKTPVTSPAAMVNNMRAETPRKERLYKPWSLGLFGANLLIAADKAISKWL
jgi:hypothetical protein